MFVEQHVYRPTCVSFVEQHLDKQMCAQSSVSSFPVFLLQHAAGICVRGQVDCGSRVKHATLKDCTSII